MCLRWIAPRRRDQRAMGRSGRDWRFASQFRRPGSSASAAWFVSHSGRSRMLHRRPRRSRAGEPPRRSRLRPWRFGIAAPLRKPFSMFNILSHRHEAGRKADGRSVVAFLTRVGENNFAVPLDRKANRELRIVAPVTGKASSHGPFEDNEVPVSLHGIDLGFSTTRKSYVGMTQCGRLHFDARRSAETKDRASGRLPADRGKFAAGTTVENHLFVHSAKRALHESSAGLRLVRTPRHEAGD